jgi:hypothetical protein
MATDRGPLCINNSFRRMDTRGRGGESNSFITHFRVATYRRPRANRAGSKISPTEGAGALDRQPEGSVQEFVGPKFRLPAIPYIRLRQLTMMPARCSCGNGFRTLAGTADIAGSFH